MRSAPLWLSRGANGRLRRCWRCSGSITGIVDPDGLTLEGLGGELSIHGCGVGEGVIRWGRMISPEEWSKELDPQLCASFYSPLLRLQESVGRVYCVEAPPPRYWEARSFARALWTCCDDDDMRQLVGDCEEGAAQFAYFAALHVAQAVLQGQCNPRVESSADKPYSALATFVLELLDGVEAGSPGRTKPA